MQMQAAVQILGAFVSLPCWVQRAFHFLLSVAIMRCPRAVVSSPSGFCHATWPSHRHPCAVLSVRTTLPVPHCLKQRTLLGIQNFTPVPFKQACYQTLHWHQNNDIKCKSSGSTHRVLTRGAMKVHPSKLPPLLLLCGITCSVHTTGGHEGLPFGHFFAVE